MARMPPKRCDALLVLAAPRSGSSWFASMMRNTGCLGNCREWLSSLVDSNAKSIFATPPYGIQQRDAFMSALRAAATSPNGVWSLKITGHMLDSLPAILARWGLGDGDGDGWLPELMGSAAVLHLRRRDRIGSAISWWRATHNGQFARLASDESPALGWPTYDLPSLRRALTDVDQFDHRVTRAAATLRTAGLAVLEGAYEDALHEPASFLRTFAGLAQIDIASAVIKTSELLLQRDDTTEEIRARLIADLAVC